MEMTKAVHIALLVTAIFLVAANVDIGLRSSDLLPYNADNIDIVFSFAVDNIPLHYYQSETLIQTLKLFSPGSSIFLQYHSSVKSDFIEHVRGMGVHPHMLPPFLTGAHLNKVVQLLALINTSADAVILLDVDMIALRPFVHILQDRDSFGAKLVDFDNPPLTILANIFDEAGVQTKDIVSVDCRSSNATTMGSNLNGGFYYIPRRHIRTLATSWRSWATWLHSRPHVFPDDKWRINIDQISMALALSSNQIPVVHLPSNLNQPTHMPCSPRSQIQNTPSMILHYHRHLSALGLLSASLDLALKDSVWQANSIISELNTKYYLAYLKSVSLPTVTPQPSQNIMDWLNANIWSYRLIIHAGTPATKTSELQQFFYHARDDLASLGVLYSNTVDEHSSHKWLGDAVGNDDEFGFIAMMKRVFEEADTRGGIHTIILSEERLYAMWFLRSLKTSSILHALGMMTNTTIWVCFREPKSFMAILYHQQQLDADKTTDFRTAVDDHLHLHLNYIGFFLEAEAIFGAAHVRAFKFDNDTILDACNALSISREMCAGVAKRNLGAAQDRIAQMYEPNSVAPTPKNTGSLDSETVLLDADDAAYVNVLISRQRRHYNDVFGFEFF